MSLKQPRLQICFTGYLSRSGDAPRKICVLGQFEVLEDFYLESNIECDLSVKKKKVHTHPLFLVGPLYPAKRARDRLLLGVIYREVFGVDKEVEYLLLR